LLPNTESVSGATSVLQLTPLASDDELVSQLNIEKRPRVGNSLLATTDILQVRPEVNDWPGNATNGDAESGKTAARNGTTVGCPAGYQESAAGTASVEEQVRTHVSTENYGEPVEIDLNQFYMSSASLARVNLAMMLPNLDMAMVEQELAVITGQQCQSVEDIDRCDISLLQEDDIEGPHSTTAVLHTPVSDILSHQMPQTTSGLPCASISHSSLSARPISVTSGENGSGESGSLASGCEIPRWCSSLPATLLPNSLFCSPTREVAPSSLSKQVDMTSEAGTIIPQQKASSDDVQLVSERATIEYQLPTNVRSVSSDTPAMYRAESVCSPVGHITGTMDSLSIDNYNNHHPLLRGMLTEATQQIGARDQKKNPADQVVVFLIVVVFISVTINTIQ